MRFRTGSAAKILKLTNGSYYQVPVIQFEDRIVYESGPDTLDVARFVDEEFGQNKLFPKKFEGLQQIIVPYIENDVEGTTFKILDSYSLIIFEDVRARGMMIRHKERKFGRGCVEDLWQVCACRRPLARSNEIGFAACPRS